MSDKENDGWHDFPAPTMERVIVSGWQKQSRTCAGYWWVHEDNTDEFGKPFERPDATLWRPFPKAPNRPDPTRTEAHP